MEQSQLTPVEEEHLSFLERAQAAGTTAVEAVRGRALEASLALMGSMALSGTNAEAATPREREMSRAFTYQEFTEKRQAYEGLFQSVSSFQYSVNPNKDKHMYYVEDMATNPQMLAESCLDGLYGKVKYSLKGRQVKVSVEQKDNLLSVPIAKDTNGQEVNYELDCNGKLDISTSVELWKRRAKVRNAGDNHTRIREVKAKKLPEIMTNYTAGPENTNKDIKPNNQVSRVTMNLSAPVMAMVRKKLVYPTIVTRVSSNVNLYKNKSSLVLQPIRQGKNIATRADRRNAGTGKSIHPVARYGHGKLYKAIRFDRYERTSSDK